MGPSVSLDNLKKRKFPYLCRETNSILAAPATLLFTKYSHYK